MSIAAELRSPALAFRRSCEPYICAAVLRLLVPHLTLADAQALLQTSQSCRQATWAASAELRALAQVCSSLTVSTLPRAA